MAKSKTTKSSDSLPTAPKIIDVSADSTVGASSSSRPVIVSNRPIMRDPMMAPSAESAETSGNEKSAGSAPDSPVDSTDLGSAPSLPSKLAPPSVTKKRITPPGQKADTQADTKISDITPAEKPSDPAKPATTKIDIVGVTTHDSIPESAKSAEKTTKSDNAKQSTNDHSDGDGDTNSSDSDDSSESDKDSEAAAAAEALEAAETQEADQAAKIAKLIESKAYILPINAIQKRRSEQTALLGMFLIILLAFAWLDLATDVGLIHVPYLPVTHFFGR